MCRAHPRSRCPFCALLNIRKISPRAKQLYAADFFARGVRLHGRKMLLGITDTIHWMSRGTLLRP